MNASRQILVLWYFLFLAVLLMLLEWLRGLNVDFPAFTDFREVVTGLLLARSGQAILVAGFSVWFLAMLWMDLRIRDGFSERGYWKSITLCDLCKTYLVVVSLLVFAAGWNTLPESANAQSFRLGIDQSTNVLVLLAGILLSQAVGNILSRTKGGAPGFARAAVIFFVIVLAATSLLHSKIPFEYKYRAQPRWSGLWVNPNIYGLLMATGIVLATGILVESLICGVQSHPNAERGARSVNLQQRLKIILLLGAAIVMTFGLTKSYSRGAWLAAATGLMYLAVEAVRRLRRSALAVWLYRNTVTLTVVALSIGVLSFWHFRETERTVARRVFSVANANDFSWRNRITAWEGSLQMMAERPWFGFGWDQSEPVYEQYYRPAQVPDGLAIEMNDFFMLGTTLGIPALAFFAAYLWLSLGRNAEGEMRSADLDWLEMVCRAGAVALLVGFWFDGGLFKMATATPFWILLELGRADRSTQACWRDNAEEGQTP